MKIVAGALTSLLLGAGALVAAQPAQAAGPYPHTVATSCAASMARTTWLAGENATVNVKVVAGNAAPAGAITVNGVAGGAGNRSVGRLPVGRHSVSVRFEPGASSVFKPCATAISFEVVKGDPQGKAKVAASKSVAANQAAKAAKTEAAQATRAAKAAKAAAKRAAKAVKKAKTPAAKAEAKRVAKAAAAVAKSASAKAGKATKVAKAQTKVAKKAAKAAKVAKKKAQRR